jgi:hypothetical protein
MIAVVTIAAQCRSPEARARHGLGSVGHVGQLGRSANAISSHGILVEGQAPVAVITHQAATAGTQPARSSCMAGSVQHKEQL